MLMAWGRMVRFIFFFFQAEDGIRDVERSRGLGDVYKRQEYMGSDWRSAFFDQAFPRIDLFCPDLILISAGFDANVLDPISDGLGKLEDTDYYEITAELVHLSRKHCMGRLISVLEGGYGTRGGALSPLAQSILQHVEALSSRKQHSQYYSCLLYTSPSPRDLSTSRMPSSA
eukprot:TRINITY_DN11763_c0_g1_i1.p1 TRINITY_DN11763_c0_g1~~TRINITY_DN11763_c0_g1_i1.p1  ORF type:complete len:172 (-),score=28.98 TRINITY_DN11763_c0_g1_i1:91-606(-)